MVPQQELYQTPPDEPIVEMYADYHGSYTYSDKQHVVALPFLTMSLLPPLLGCGGQELLYLTSGCWIGQWISLEY